MIKTRKELKECLKIEKQLYPNKLIDIITNDQRTYNWKYIKLLRKCEYYYNNNNKLIFKLLYVLCRKKKNILGSRIGIEIWENCFDVGLIIHHNGSIIVNRGCKIGKNCELHGMNCLGNAGYGDNCPIIGDNCNIGIGASVIGKVVLGNNIKIGANAVVNKSFDKNDITLVGVPAKEVIK